VLDHQVDASDVHVNDAPRPNIEMSNFAVAHLPLGEANKWSAGMNQRVGILAQQAVVSRFARQGNGVSLGFGAVSPAVEDNEDEWFRTGHGSCYCFFVSDDGAFCFCASSFAIFSTFSVVSSTILRSRGCTACIPSAAIAGISPKIFCPVGVE